MDQNSRRPSCNKALPPTEAQLRLNELAFKHISTEGHTDVKSILKQSKVFTESIMLHSELSNHKGVLSRDRYQRLVQDDEHYEVLRNAGLDHEQIKFYEERQQKINSNTKKRKLENSEVCDKYLKDIENKLLRRKQQLEDQKEDKFANVKKLGRHRMQLENLLLKLRPGAQHPLAANLQHLVAPSSASTTSTPRSPQPPGSSQQYAAGSSSPSTNLRLQARRVDTPSRRDSAATHRDCATSIRDSAPTQRDGSPSIRDSAPTQRDCATSIRDSSPTQRDCTTSIRDSAPTQRDGSPSIKDSSTPILRNDPGINSQYPHNSWTKQASIEERMTSVIEILNQQKRSYICDDYICTHRLSRDEIVNLKPFRNYSPGLIPSEILYVKNLHKRVTIIDLQDIFERFSSHSSSIDYQLLSGRMRGQAFIDFHDVNCAKNALEKVNGFLVEGQPIIISYKKSSINKT